MIGTSTIHKLSGQIKFSKNEILSLSKIRIIKKNLVHVHGLPSSLLNTDKLSQIEYFGQYGKIEDILLSSKTNNETNKKSFSVYITYSNEKEASFAILSVDSLLIEGKLVRTFFGTTKYCNYFLNNRSCPNEDKCVFLHELIKDKNIILDTNTIFSYNDHLNLAKKIIQFSNPKTKLIAMNLIKPNKTIFPKIDFIFLNENQKEYYFQSSNISYIRSNSNKLEINNYSINVTKNDRNENNIINVFKYKIINNFNNSNKKIIQIKNKSKNDFCINNNENIIQINALNKINRKQICHNLDELYGINIILQKPIKQILELKTFCPNNNKDILLKKLELNYFINELNRKGINFYTFFDGCLDCINDINC